MKLRAGIVGLGSIGTAHYQMYSQHPLIKETLVADTDSCKWQALPVPGYTDYRLLRDKVDLVSIATPTSTHFEIARYFLSHKIPVLVEKPITSHLQQASALIGLSRRHTTLLLVGHVERYNNAYLAIKRFVKNPKFIECHRLSLFPHRSLDTSVLLDLMIHDIDIILDLVKDSVKQIQVKGVKVISPTIDIANARLTFTQGCVANITASRISAKKERKIRIFMPNRYISVNFAEQYAESYQKIQQDIKKIVIPVTKEQPLMKEINTFIQYVRNKKFTLSIAEQAYTALKLVLKIQNLIEKN